MRNEDGTSGKKWHKTDTGGSPSVPAHACETEGRIGEIAEWLAVHRDECPDALVPFLKRRFGLRAASAIQVIRQANALRQERDRSKAEKLTSDEKSVIAIVAQYRELGLKPPRIDDIAKVSGRTRKDIQAILEGLLTRKILAPVVCGGRSAQPRYKIVEHGGVSQ